MADLSYKVNDIGDFQGLRRNIAPSVAQPTYLHVRLPLKKAFDNLEWLLGVAVIDQELPFTRRCLGISFEEAQLMVFWRTRRRWLALLINEMLRMGISLTSPTGRRSWWR